METTRPSEHILGVIDGVAPSHLIFAGRLALIQGVVSGVVERTVFRVGTAYVVYVTPMRIRIYMRVSSGNAMGKKSRLLLLMVLYY